MGRIRKRHGPIYPLRIENVVNQGLYFVGFSVNLGGLIPASAWIDTTKVVLGGPVIVEVASANDQKSTVSTLATGIGAPIPGNLNVPLWFSLFSAYTAVNAEFGWEVANGSGTLGLGTLVYSATGVTHSGPLAPNFVLTTTSTITPILQTGTKDNVFSYALQGLRAIPTVEANKYELTWKPLGSAEGFAVAQMTLFSTVPCPPCNLIAPLQ